MSLLYIFPCTLLHFCFCCCTSGCSRTHVQIHLTPYLFAKQYSILQKFAFFRSNSWTHTCELTYDISDRILCAEKVFLHMLVGSFVDYTSCLNVAWKSFLTIFLLFFEANTATWIICTLTPSTFYTGNYRELFTIFATLKGSHLDSAPSDTKGGTGPPIYIVILLNRTAAAAEA